MNKFVEFMNRSKEPLVISIDPSGKGTSGIYLKYRKPNAKSLTIFMDEIYANNAVEAANKIAKKISEWEKQIFKKADFIAVEELVPLEIVGRINSVPTEVQETLGLIYLLKAIYKERYLGFYPNEKNRARYFEIRKKDTMFRLYKKSEHILDAYLIYDRSLETIYQRKAYKNYQGERISNE